jgi:hypothetical protein
VADTVAGTVAGTAEVTVKALAMAATFLVMGGTVMAVAGE